MAVMTESEVAQERSRPNIGVLLMLSKIVKEEKFSELWDRRVTKICVEGVFPLDSNWEIVKGIDIATGELQSQDWTYEPRVYRPTLYPIFSLEHPRYELRQPIIVRIEHEYSTFYATDETFGITGVGDTIEEAVKDLKDFLIEDYLTYESTPDDQLSEGALELLQKYQGLIYEP